MTRVGRRAQGTVAFLFLLALLACGQGEEQGASALEVVDQLKYLDRAYESAAGASMLKEWARFRGQEESGKATGGALLGFQRDQVLEWSTRLEDPYEARLARRLVPAVLEYANTNDPRLQAASREILELELEGHRLDDRPIERRELLRILRSAASEDELAQAWKSLYAEPGWRKASSLKRLIDLRRTLSGVLGFTDYEAMSFAFIGIEASSARRLLSELEAQTRSAAQKLSVQLTAAGDEGILRPWRLQRLDPVVVTRLEELLDADSCVQRAKATVAGLGLPLPDTVRIDTERVDGRSEHFLTFAVAVPSDIRVLVTTDAGLWAQRSVLHELGHATWLSRASAELFVQRLPESRILSEGYAKLFERLVDEPQWLREVAGLEESELEAVRSHQRRDELLRLRRLLALHEVESMAYRDPRADLEAIFVSSMSRLAGIEIEAEDAEAWAAPSHLVTQPYSSMQYLLARVVAAQLRRALIERHGQLIGCEPCGQELATLIEDAATIDWEQLIVEFTGEPLNVEAYIEDVLKIEPGKSS